jgi:hypothetical protein
MASESWIVLTVAAAFLLVGIAVSPLAWVAIWYRRSRSERLSDRRFIELQAQVRTLNERMAGLESSLLTLQSGRDSSRESMTRPGTFRTTAARGWLRVDGDEAAPTRSPVEPRLIVVPNLASASGDREGMLSGLTQRYAAIWTLADTGASPEVIARATGQPIGQIELILGLRRQIDGTRTTIPHASHE